MRRTLNLDKLDSRQDYSDELLYEGLIAIAREMRRRSDMSIDDYIPAYATMNKVNHDILEKLLHDMQEIKTSPW